MHRIFASAAYRVAFTYSCVFALAILALGVSVYLAADAEFRRQHDAGIAEESSLLLREYREGGIPDVTDAIAKREAVQASSSYRYALLDATGRHRAGKLAAAGRSSGFADLALDVGTGSTIPARALVNVLPGGERLVVAADLRALKRIDATILGLFGAAFILVLCLGLAGALILGSYLRRRLARISGTASAIIAGDLGQRITLGGTKDEFDELGIALNAMLDRISLLLENLRQVSCDIAHDLRTPLARLRGQIESALDIDRDPSTHRQTLKRALAQSDELLSLFAAILRIAEVESGALTRHFDCVDLSAITHEICDTYKPAVSDDGRSLDCRIDPDARILGDRELLAQALINLLDNAQRHTPTSTRISVALETEDTMVSLTVFDDGPGVPESEHERIRRRFARLDASRATPGHGLGLNLVSAIASAHGGRMLIEDNRPGLRVRLTLPRQQADPAR